MSAPVTEVHCNSSYEDALEFESSEEMPLLDKVDRSKLIEEGWQLSWAQAHGIMLLTTFIYATWNCINRSVGKSNASPIAFVSLRLAGALILLVGLQCATAPWQILPTELKVNFKRYAMMGVLLCGIQMLLMAGTALTSATTLALFQSVEPSTAVLLGFILRMEDPHTLPRRLLSAAVAGFGVAVTLLWHEQDMGSPEHGSSAHGSIEKNFGHLIGCMLLLSQGCCLVLYYLNQTMLLEAKSSTRTPLLMTTCACGCALPISVLVVVLNILVLPIDSKLTSFNEVFVVFTEYPTDGTLPPFAGLLYAILFASVAGYLLCGTANTRLEASEMVMYQAVQLPITAAMSVFFLQEHINPSTGVGAVIIFCAVLMRSPAVCPLVFLNEKGV